jgi:tetratricopeptide (TPR) repeat protein
MNGAAIQQISDAATIAGANGSDVATGLDVAMHISKLSAHVLGPQMSANQEDEADALGFDLMVKAGYNPDAASQVMDKLAEQEAEAARAAKAAKDAEKAASHGSGGGGFSLGSVMGAVNGAMSGDWKTRAVFAFDAAVDNMSDEAVSHHPAPERKKMVSDYAFKQYRDTLPVAPTALPWAAPTKKDRDGLAMKAVLTHYGAAEDAAAYIADPTQGTDAKARGDVTMSSTVPTTDHAYTQFVAYEYYDKAGQKAQSEAALVRAANGPEASWEVYSRLIDLHMARNDYSGALHVMDQATLRFEDSPVLLPKHIQIYAKMGDFSNARALLPKCKSYDIDELYDACKKEAGSG